MSAPDRIWAVFEPHENSKDLIPRVFASASPTRGAEYRRADLCAPTQNERVRRLVKVEEGFMDAVWEALKADANDLRKQRRILEAFRAALRDLEQGER